MTIPNILTSLRILLIPVFIVASLQRAFDIAFFVFIAAALTDALDGYIARRFDMRSRLGAILDPGADKTMLVSGYVVYTIAGVAPYGLPISLTLTVFMRDVAMVFVAYLLYTRIRIRRFPPTILGKLSTIFQAVALAVTMGSNMFLAPVLLPLLFWAQAAALIMTLLSGWDYLRLWALYLEQPGVRISDTT